MTYFYRAYGVGISSDFPIPSLISAKLLPQDVNLHLTTGPEPDWVRSARALPARILSHLPADTATADPAFVLTEYGRGHCYELSYSDGARFVLDETARHLWGTVVSPLHDEDLPLYFLGPVMGFYLRHQHVTCLHASAVQLHDRAVLFSGDVGIGKSTTAAALALRGAPVFSEDIVPLESSAGCYSVIPGYPRVCLWPDAVTKLLGHPDVLPRLSSTWEKRYLPLDGARAGFASHQKPLGIIYLFGDRSSDSSAPRVEELRPREAVLELVKNTYMNWLLDRERRAREFDELCRLAQQVPIRRIIAHRDPAKLSDLCELIFNDARQLLLSQ